MKNIKIKDLALLALSISMITIGTMAIQIPIPATNGYIHVGDGIILLVAATFGARYGAIAGGFGSALADIITGYAIWAPFTLIIKALMGFIMGFASGGKNSTDRYTSTKALIGSILSILMMLSGYFLAESFLSGSFEVALFSIPWNSLQGLSGIIIYVLIGHIFDRVNIRGKVK